MSKVGEGGQALTVENGNLSEEFVNDRLASLIEAYPALVKIPQLRQVAEQVVLLAADLKVRKGQPQRPYQYEWLFELAGRLKAHASDQTAEQLAPLAVLFSELVREKGLAATAGRKDRLNWEDPDEVMLEFEASWHKRKFPKGADALARAVYDATAAPLNIQGNKYYVRLLSTAHNLQEMYPGEAIFLPVSAKTAKLFGTTSMTVSNAITKAIREGVLSVVGDPPSISARRARKFIVNMDHPYFVSARSSSKASPHVE